MLKKFKTVLTIACMAFVFLVMNAKALAYTGTGTEEDPYVVYTYAELASLVNYNDAWDYGSSENPVCYKLGQDIISTDNVNDDLMMFVGKDNGPNFLRIDLAGHKMSRKSTSTDIAMFVILRGALIIDDSIGGGSIYCSISHGYNGYGDIFHMKPKYTSSVQGDLIINGGIFEVTGALGKIITSGASGGTVTINDGVFIGEICDNRYFSSGSVTNYCINGGLFTQITIDGQGDISLNNCTVKLLRSSGYNKISSFIKEGSIVTVDGNVVSDLNVTELSGNIEISDPNSPKITQQLESYTFPYLGTEHAYAITVENAESGTWYVVDDENNRYTSDYIMEQGWADIEFKKSGNTHKMVFSNVTADLDGMKVYCKIKGNGYTIKSSEAEIHVAKKVKDISAEITNLNKAVAGRSANAFTGVRLRDFRGRTTEYQSGSVQWHTADGTLFEGKLVKDANMKIRISIDLTDGYEFADDAGCTVKNVSGSDVTATKLADQSTATHAVFEIPYVVQEAADWSFSSYAVRIENGLGLTVDDPMERPGLNAEYSDVIRNWRPGKYVLLRPSIPDGKELDYWAVTVQFAIPKSTIGGFDVTTYSYEDTLSETFFSEIDPMKLSASDRKTVNAAIKAGLNVGCVVRLTPVFRDKPVTCVVSFDANGGEGTMGNKQVRQFEKYLLPACKFTWTGHDFIGWTVGDGTEVYQPGTSIDITGDVTLHAQWKLSVCLIMVDLGSTSERKGEVKFNGSVQAAYFCDYGSIVTLEAVPFSGYEFKQWEENGAGIYGLPNYTFAAEGDRVLTPVFETKKVRIHFEGNYGQGTMADQRVEYDSLYTLPECGFTNEYATFIGWKVGYGDSVDPTICQPGKQFRFTDDVTVTAQWEYTELPLVKELIPDDKFRAYLRSDEIDKDGDGKLSQRELSRANNLKCNGLGISNLEGVQYFYELNYLLCDDNNLTSIDVSRNSKLLTLSCRNNQLTKLNVSQNSELTSLYITGNSISDINLKNNKKLSIVDLSGNPLKTLDVSDLSELTQFSASNCQLTSLTLGTHPDLEYLWCDTNPDLAFLNLNGCPNLLYLQCDQTKLTDLNFSLLTKLIELHYSDVSLLTELDLSANALLERVYVENCNLSSIHLSNLSELITLSVKGNALTQLDVSENPMLDYLNCTNNQLSVLDVSNCDKLKKGGGGRVYVDKGVIVYETTPERYTVTVQCDTALGSVSIASNTWIQADKVTVTATPKDGCFFVAWKENGEVVSEDATYVFTADKNRNLVAEFVDELILMDDHLKISKKSLTLYDTITIDFKISASALEGYHDPYLVVTQNGATDRITNYATSDDGTILIFTYRVAPHKMGDKVTAVPHALNAYGADVTGKSTEYSVVDYCINILGNVKYQTDDYAVLRRLLVDILLYGDAAQVFMNYKTDKLASKILSDEQRAMGTDVSAAMTYRSVRKKEYLKVEEEDALAHIDAVALYLEAAVNVQFKFSTSDPSGLRVVITDNENCTHVIAEYPANREIIDDNGLYYVNVDCLNAGEMRKTIYATVMQGDKKVSNTFRYSIESYAASMTNREGYENLGLLLDAMMRYGDSAASFVEELNR